MSILHWYDQTEWALRQRTRAKKPLSPYGVQKAIEGLARRKDSDWERDDADLRRNFRRYSVGSTQPNQRTLRFVEGLLPGSSKPLHHPLYALLKSPYPTWGYALRLASDWSETHRSIDLARYLQHDPHDRAQHVSHALLYNPDLDSLGVISALLLQPAYVCERNVLAAQQFRMRLAQCAARLLLVLSLTPVLGRIWEGLYSLYCDTILAPLNDQFRFSIFIESYRFHDARQLMAALIVERWGSLDSLPTNLSVRRWACHLMNGGMRTAHSHALNPPCVRADEDWNKRDVALALSRIAWHHGRLTGLLTEFRLEPSDSPGSRMSPAAPSVPDGYETRDALSGWL